MRIGSALLLTFSGACLAATALLGACSSAEVSVDAGAAGSGPIVPPEPDGGFGDTPEGLECTEASDCAEGLFCLPLFAPAGDDSWLRCVRGCDTASQCGAGTCFGKFGSVAGDHPLGFCGEEGGLGAACSPEALRFCKGDPSTQLVCYPGTGEDGRCYEVCDPGAGGACSQAGESCSDFFGRDDFGICVVPSADHACDLETSFCGAGEACTIIDPEQPGRCFVTCSPELAPGCPEGLACAAPFTDPLQGICVGVGQTNAPCAPTEYSFCAAADICVDEGVDGLRCRRSCTEDATTCEQFAAERTCRALPGDAEERSICAP